MGWVRGPFPSTVYSISEPAGAPSFCRVSRVNGESVVEIDEAKVDGQGRIPACPLHRTRRSRR